MRSPLGSSIAAARTKASMAPLTRLAAAPLRMGSWLRTPLMSVKEAAVGDVIAPEEHQWTWPISLSFESILPAVATRASNLPMRRNRPRMEPMSGGVDLQRATGAADLDDLRGGP
jgi:hypothetical protein